MPNPNKKYLKQQLHGRENGWNLSTKREPEQRFAISALREMSQDGTKEPAAEKRSQSSPATRHIASYSPPGSPTWKQTTAVKFATNERFATSSLLSFEADDTQKSTKTVTLAAKYSNQEVHGRKAPEGSPDWNHATDINIEASDRFATSLLRDTTATDGSGPTEQDKTSNKKMPLIKKYLQEDLHGRNVPEGKQPWSNDTETKIGTYERFAISSLRGPWEDEDSDDADTQHRAATNTNRS
eukprot:TRINITY_DN93460_c0_g1_i1.p1 TRINITY_DN93460_c0_g1~~TRINITY_DN93460_c0_g1_i1.p1  ORF type:complete len:240 (-),score=36.07 TRINITY_DN93460_c0_g1_i1:556-1275(-)